MLDGCQPLDLAESDPEAVTLFGYEPRKRCICPGCRILAEPYVGKHCWFCEATGLAALQRRQATKHDLRFVLGYEGDPCPN